MCSRVTRWKFRVMMISGKKAKHQELKALGRLNAMDEAIKVEKVHLEMVLA